MNWFNILSEPRLSNVIILFMMPRWPQLFWVNSIILQIDITQFICRNISNIFGHAQIYTNDCFVPKSSSIKGDNFRVSLLYRNDNRRGRAPMVSLSSWWVLSVLSSNVAIFQSTWHSPTREQCGKITEWYLVILDIEILGVVDKSIYLLLF